MKHWKTFLVGLMAAGLLAACSSSDNAPGAGTNSAPETVSATLTEWQITLDKTSVAKGGTGFSKAGNTHKVTFTAVNNGTEPHELVILKTDLPFDGLETSDGKVNEATAGQVIGEIEEFPAGERGEITLDLPEGAYVLFCNIAEEENGVIKSHYERGMRVALTVDTPSGNKSALIDATAGGLGVDPADLKKNTLISIYRQDKSWP